MSTGVYRRRPWPPQGRRPYLFHVWPAATGGTTLEFNGGLALSSGMEVMPGRSLYFESGLVLSSGMVVAPQREAEFNSGISLTAGMVVDPQREVEFSGGLVLSSGMVTDPQRELEFNGGLVLSSGMELTQDITLEFSSGLVLSSGMAVAPQREAQFSGGLVLSSGMAVVPQREAEFSSGLTVSSGMVVTPGRELEFSGGITVSSGLDVHPGRELEFNSGLALSSGVQLEVPLPSWTLTGGDSTHMVTDGPRIDAGLLDPAAGGTGVGQSGYGTTDGAGRVMTPTSPSYEQVQFITFGDISDARYFEMEVVGTPVWGQGAGFAANDYSPGVNTPVNIGGDSDPANIGLVCGNISGTNGQGYVYQNGSILSTDTPTIIAGDILMCAIDPTVGANGTVWFGVNGTWMDSGNPATGANGYALTAGHTYRPFVFGYVNHGGIINTGQRPFAYTLPAGFAGLGAFP